LQKRNLAEIVKEKYWRSVNEEEQEALNKAV
jgi:hypothetical protein